MAEITASQCAKCGACTVVCPVFQAAGRESLSARGRLHLLARLDPAKDSTAWAEILSQCLLCGACRSVCSRGLDPPALFITARERLGKTAGQNFLLRTITRKVLSNQTLQAAIADLGRPLLDLLPVDSGLRLRLGLPPQGPAIFPTQEETRQKNSAPPVMAYFPGCYASHLHRKIGEATRRIATKFTGSALYTPTQQSCCGLAAESAGDSATAKRLARENILAFAENTLPILTSCASCYSHLRRYPQLFAEEPEWQTKAQGFADRLVEFSTFVAQLMEADSGFRFAASPFPRIVFYHDPCHLRFHTRITGPPRKILQAISGLTLAELPNGPQCCGHGGLFHLAQPVVAEKIIGRLLNQVAKASPDLVTTTCSGCLMHIRQGFGPEGPEVQHLAILLAGFL